MKPTTTNDAPVYDVIVAGAGPAGATAAYYLASGMREGAGRSVALLEKARFPRDKICGDAWCAPALDILEEMGVLQRLEAEGLVRDTRSGGFISPAGESFVGGGDQPGAPGTRVYAIKRILCDERIARRAAEAGAELHEEAAVADVRLDGDGLWTVSCGDGRSFRGRILIAADGAGSHIARRLGVVKTPATAAAGRRYVKGGTHNFRADGVLFYPSYVLPGYVALFRHYDDDIDLGCYVIPGGATSPGDIKSLYTRNIAADPFIRAVLGPRAEYREPVRIAPLRLGGEPLSYSRQFLAVGDAAGQTDPLTGEGIHTAMIAAKLAAATVLEMFAAGDFSERGGARYQQRWMAAFGREFRASAMGARAVYRFPFLLDAAAVVAQSKGQGFMEEFGAAMTGVKPKTTFLKPSVAGPLTAEMLRQILRRKDPALDAAQLYARGVAAGAERETAFRNACLREAYTADR